MVPVPLQMRVSSVYICAVPARQGMHLPQDSVMQNSMKKRATLTMQEVSSMTIMPPEPMMEPIFEQRVVADADVEHFGGNAAAGGTAGLHRLECVAVGNAAADALDDLAELDAHGHFNQAGVGDLAGEREDLGALAALRAHARRTTCRRCE